MAEDSTVAIVAIAVSGGVALLAAVVTPITAHFRQKAALNAESSRLDRQLEHDRMLRDIEESRVRLDDAIDMGEAALSAICSARLAYNAGNQQSCDDEMWQARNCLGQHGYKERRVRLRVGLSHPLVDRLVEYRLAVQEMYDFVHGHIAKREAIPADAWNAAMGKVAAAQVAVIAEGGRAVGAHIHTRTEPTEIGSPSRAER